MNTLVLCILLDCLLLLSHINGLFTNRTKALHFHFSIFHVSLRFTIMVGHLLLSTLNRSRCTFEITENSWLKSYVSDSMCYQ